MSYDEDRPATVSVIVLDWWTEQPLQGVPVRVADHSDAVRADCQGRYRSTLTDDRGRAEFPAETGSVIVFIPPDFEQQVFTIAGEVTEVRFLCPDFVKKVRHGF